MITVNIIFLFVFIKGNQSVASLIEALSLFCVKSVVEPLTCAMHILGIKLKMLSKISQLNAKVQDDY